MKNFLVDCAISALKLQLYGISVHMVVTMDTVSVNRFRDNLKSIVEQSVRDHTPVKVTRRAGEAFIVMSADDWEREQETLYVLQNNDLMKQIADSLRSHNQSSGYKPSEEEIDEITGLRG